MPQISCPVCKSPLSKKKRYINCPWCGIVLAPADEHAQEAILAQYRSGPTGHEWALACVLSMFAFGLIASGYKWMEPIQEDPTAEKTASALSACQQRIATLAASPSPPHAQNEDNYPQFHFTWPEGTLGRQSSVAHLSATCRGDLRTGRITEVSVNGRQSASSQGRMADR